MPDSSDCRLCTCMHLRQEKYAHFISVIYLYIKVYVCMYIYVYMCCGTGGHGDHRRPDQPHHLGQQPVGLPADLVGEEARRAHAKLLNPRHIKKCCNHVCSLGVGIFIRASCICLGVVLLRARKGPSLAFFSLVLLEKHHHFCLLVYCSMGGKIDL